MQFLHTGCRWQLVRGFVFGVLLFGSLAVARQSCDELNEKWLKHYHPQLEVAWEAREFSCGRSSKDVSYKLATAVDLISGLQSHFDFYLFVADHVQHTRYDKACDKHVIASMNPATGRMKLCDPFLSRTYVQGSATLVHEASHARKGDVGHVVCKNKKSTTPPRASSYHEVCELAEDPTNARGCDAEFYGELGRGSGYNYAAVYYRELLEDSSFHRSVHDQARAALKVLLLSKFNKISEEKKKKWLAL